MARRYANSEPAPTAAAPASPPKARSATASSPPPNGTRALLRTGGTDDGLADLVRDCVLAKVPAHGIGTEELVRPERAMYQIGGVKSVVGT